MTPQPSRGDLLAGALIALIGGPLMAAAMFWAWYHYGWAGFVVALIVCAIVAFVGAVWLA